MCRVLMYQGEPVCLDDLLFQPNNSLVRQASSPQMLDMLSLAGFGMLGWDHASHRPEVPFSYRSVDIPAFDPNLKGLAEKLRVSTLIAHVRGVVADDNPTVGEQNLHPFRYSGCRLALAHNGFLAGFGRMRFTLLDHIKPEIARRIKGNTDTEWIYALLLSQLRDPWATLGPDEIVDAVEKALAILRETRKDHDIALASPVNLFISDGASLVAVRFTFDYGCYDMQAPAKIRDSSHLFLSAWYTVGKSYGLHDGEWKMTSGPGGRARIGAGVVRTPDAGHVDLVRSAGIQCVDRDGRKRQSTAAREGAGDLASRGAQVIAKTFRLVALLAHEAEQREEIIRAQIAGRARDLTLLRLLLGKAGRGLGEELEGRRETHAIFRRQRFFRNFLAVEVRHLARSDDVELQHLEIALHVFLDVGTREVHQMRFLTVGAAAQLPHDGETLGHRGRALQVVTKLEEAFEEPRLPVEPVIGQGRAGARRRREAHRRHSADHCAPRQHVMIR
jgi:glutamine amidotransferase